MNTLTYVNENENEIKATLEAAQNNLVSATVKHTMTGRPASPEAEQLIDALFAYARLLENIAFGAGGGEGILN